MGLANYCVLCSALAALVASAIFFQASSLSSLADVVEVAVEPAPGSPALLRQELVERPSDGNLSAVLALALLESTDEIAPNTDADSLYGGKLTLYHPDLAEAKQLVERALKLSPGVPEAHLAHQAVLMAEGNGEDALQAGRKACELRPDSADMYIDLARAHLLAGCAQGCAARNDLRAEKAEEKKRGRRSALEKREADGRKDEERKAAREKGEVKNHLSQGREALRAGAMWRIMEAGRLLKQASEYEPTNLRAKKLERKSRHLITLDAHKVLSTQQVIDNGQCHFFFGQELDGHLCDKRRYKYE